MVALLAWVLTRKRTKPESFPAAARLWKGLFVGCWGVGLTCILALTVLVYGRHPLAPDPATGHTYSYNLHGTNIYLAREEQDALRLFEKLTFSNVLLGFVCGFIMQRQQIRVDDRKYIRPKPDRKS